MNCHMECQDYTKCYRTTPHIMQGHLSHLTSFSPPQQQRNLSEIRKMGAKPFNLQVRTRVGRELTVFDCVQYEARKGLERRLVSYF